MMHISKYVITLILRLLWNIEDVSSFFCSIVEAMTAVSSLAMTAVLPCSTNGSDDYEIMRVKAVTSSIAAWITGDIDLLREECVRRLLPACLLLLPEFPLRPVTVSPPLFETYNPFLLRQRENLSSQGGRPPFPKPTWRMLPIPSWPWITLTPPHS